MTPNDSGNLSGKYIPTLYITKLLNNDVKILQDDKERILDLKTNSKYNTIFDKVKIIIKYFLLNKLDEYTKEYNKDKSNKRMKKMIKGILMNIKAIGGKNNILNIHNKDKFKKLTEKEFEEDEGLIILKGLETEKEEKQEEDKQKNEIDINSIYKKIKFKKVNMY
jgi:hypothetical protein